MATFKPTEAQQAMFRELFEHRVKTPTLFKCSECSQLKTQEASTTQRNGYPVCHTMTMIPVEV